MAITDKEQADRQLGLFWQKINLTDMMSETNIVKKKKKPRSTIKQNGSESQKNDSITLGNSLAWLGL